ALRDLVEVDAVLHGAVEIRVVAQPALYGGFNERRAQGIAESEILDGKRPADAVMLARAPRLVFGLAKIREHARVVPAVRAQRRPFVIVEAMAAGVAHGVDRARAAEHAAARPVQPSAIEFG